MDQRPQDRLLDAAFLELPVEADLQLRLRSLPRKIARLARRGLIARRAEPDHRLQERRSVGREKERFRHGVADLAAVVQRGDDHQRGLLLGGEQRVVGADRRPVGANLLGQGLDRRHERVLVGEKLEAQPVWMRRAHRLGHRLRDGGANPGLGEGAVEAEIDLGQAGDRGEALLVLGAVDAEDADVVERSRLEPEEILAVDEVAVRGVLTDLGDDGLVEPGRRRLDHLHTGDELAVLLGCDLARDEDAKVPDRGVQRIDDRLAVGDDLALVVVEVENPAQRLLRRGDVVAPGAEADDRRLDVSEIDADAFGRADLPGRELVADEQVVGDPLHLARVEQHGAPPPGLEFEEPLRLGIDLGIDVVGLGPVGVGGVEGLKIGDQAGPVEGSGAEVAGKRRQPCAAHRPAEIAHRVLAANACPVGERRSGQHDDASQIRPDRRRHHDLPACLAIGDDDRLAVGLGVAPGDLLQKDRLGAADILDRLPGDWLRQEADEVDRVAGAERHADFALGLHAPDPRTVAGARVDDHNRRLRRIDRRVRRRDDAREKVIDRPFQRPAVEHEFGLEGQDMRDLLRGLRKRNIAALVERLEKQHAALPRVGPVLRERAEEIRVLGHQPSSRAGLSSETPRSFAVSRPGPA